MSGTDPHGIAWPPQQQPQPLPVGSNGMTVFHDARAYVPSASIQTFCLIC